MPLAVQAFRSLGLPENVRQQVCLKERGYDEGTFVESSVILNAAGGECLEDLERLRQDPGQVETVGHGLPSPEAARKFLYAFHEEEKVEEAGQRIATVEQDATIMEGRKQHALVNYEWH